MLQAIVPLISLLVGVALMLASQLYIDAVVAVVQNKEIKGPAVTQGKGRSPMTGETFSGASFGFYARSRAWWYVSWTVMVGSGLILTEVTIFVLMMEFLTIVPMTEWLLGLILPTFLAVIVLESAISSLRELRRHE